MCACFHARCLLDWACPLAVCFNMMGESDALYRDPDKFSSSESEGEEGETVVLAD